MTVAIRTLVAHPDGDGRRRLTEALAGDECFDVVAAVAGFDDFIRTITHERLDAVFISADLPGSDGPGVLDAGGDGVPLVVLVSTRPADAVWGFDAGALDFVLEPVQHERLVRALLRVKAAVGARRLAGEARLVHAAPLAPPRPYPDLVAIKAGDQYRFVHVREIDWISAEGNYVRIHLQGTEHLLNRSLAELEERVLDPAVFLRIHRSTIVNLHRIATLAALFHGERTVILKDGTELVCSRRYRVRLQERVLFVT
jgi:two-component system LytT family response regulator